MGNGLHGRYAHAASACLLAAAQDRGKSLPADPPENVAGVCGGLGEFFDISPFWFRLLFLVLLIPGGLPGLVPYLILWIVIPKRRRR
ncbi:MAG: hypothetical protein B6I35_14600 [Anaerolineaceae bacterium 4572_32.2]|nr:MAG: hypothetical protein B6I35_14600 [Anaerolineaceae bacterium 4572_32.2]